MAGERGRQSNYIYGSSKAALTIYLSGLCNRFSKKNIQVLTVLPGLLTADPEEVAEDIYLAFKKGKNIIYAKWFWKWIMFIIKNIPEKIFKKMSL